MLVRSAWTGPPAQARKLALAWTPAQPRFAPLQEKKYPAWRLGGPRTRLQIKRIVHNQMMRTVNLNFGQTQTIKVYSPRKFGHLT